jgi:hypothetical protein
LGLVGASRKKLPNGTQVRDTLATCLSLGFGSLEIARLLHPETLGMNFLSASDQKTIESAVEISEM